MKSLIIAAHGSSVPESNQEVRTLTDRVRELAGDDFNLVECGFLERTEPKVEDLIDSHVLKGVKTVTLFPYLLSAGRHVSKDIPEIQSRHPEITIILVPHMGRANGLAELILRHVK